MITDTLADVNGLKVGDTITLKSSKLEEQDGNYYDSIATDKETIKVEIKGIYSTREKNCGRCSNGRSSRK